jgi:hypothetical protein
MDFLAISKYGNSAEDYLISMVILVVSVFASRWAYSILRKTACEWVFGLQNTLDKESLYRLANLGTYLIAVTGFFYAQNRLSFSQEVSTWLDVTPLVLGQVIFLLILANVLGPVAEVVSIRSMKEVERRGQKYLQAQNQAIERIKKHIRGLTGVLLLLIPVLTIAANVTFVPIVIWVAPPIFALIALLLCFRIILVMKRQFERSETVKVNHETPAAPEASVVVNDSDLELKESIVKFFLDIYKHRLRALKGDPAEIRLVDAQSFAPNYIYELRVMKGGDWHTRRMTIGPIGEETGSRSKCFYVIYDYHIVIKIPPNPINDLNKYTEILKKERGIVKQLSMSECIVPGASVVLKLIQRFSRRADLALEGGEDDYIKLLNIFSELQKYLRIGDTFAFFMDLSKYYFLGHIIQSLHDIEKKVHDEIHRQSEVVGDFLKFEDRYGREDIPFFLEIEKLYTRYELGLKKLLQQFNIALSPSRDQIKKWFFVHLVGDRVTEVEKDFDAQFIVELNRLVDGIISENHKTIQAYRENVKKSIHASAFTQNKAYMEGIVTNLLELLAHLKKKRVAMRDLKPDNLLVAGDRDRYPGFLAYPQEYKIGLIDVETAVILASSGSGAIEQPPLGGTPQYATPSHFFSNEVLAYRYESLSMVLHLQDWHGVIGIIYRTITGLPLFEKTAKILPTIIKTMGEHKGKEKEHFHSVNEMFWNSAVTEFREKLTAKEETLKSLSITVLDQAGKMFRGFVLDEKRTVDDQIRQCVNSRNVPMSAKDRQVLLACPYEKTKQLRKRWENTVEAQTRPGIDKSQILSLLGELEKLKLQLERQEKMLKLLDRSGVDISAYELLEFMFELVLKRMYGEEWEWLVVGDWSDAAYKTGDPSSQSTIAVTSEI